MDTKTSCITKLFIAAAMLLIALGTTAAETSSKQTEAPSPNPITRCGSRLTDDCPDEVFNFVFYEGTTVSRDCCTQLVKMGKECHDLLTILTVYGEHFEQDVIEILKRGNVVWRRCQANGEIA
uniref:Prolamin-like domain-containing protein n=1 Tax=Opuntia streptacantha TaxID=393608 RepID=A0A7C9CR96_OPUST